MKKEKINQLVDTLPLMKNLIDLEETTWFNDTDTEAQKGLSDVGMSVEDVQQADACLRRFAPFLCEKFTETQTTQGIIESDIVTIPLMRQALERHYAVTLPGRLLLKKDSHLPIAGSIKARGGIYAVLQHAEKLALAAGLLTTSDNYRLFLSEEFKRFFANYTIVVGSTGNLGLSIGIIGSSLGFNVSVYMSHEAKAWKKKKLRACGATVYECGEDYGAAVEMGRRQASTNSHALFIDDENSISLFLGYAVAGERTKTQFTQMGIKVDADHPLFVYLPCGVGGGPGGVTFGLKLAFGEHVHCFFAEPTHSPCMFLGLYTNLHDKISVYDIGVDNITAADGLAVARASHFVGKVMKPLLSGCYTVSDSQLYQLLGLLDHHENIQLEPSALAGMAGPARICSHLDYLQANQLSAKKMQHATHLVWATGGGMVPSTEMKKYLALANTC